MDLSSSSAEDELDELYCICRSSDTSRFMICCDHCEVWYHGDCISVTEQYSKKIKKFYCLICREKNPRLEIVFKGDDKKKKLKDKSKRVNNHRPIAFKWFNLFFIPAAIGSGSTFLSSTFSHTSTADRTTTNSRFGFGCRIRSQTIEIHSVVWRRGRRRPKLSFQSQTKGRGQGQRISTHHFFGSRYLLLVLLTHISAKFQNNRRQTIAVLLKRMQLHHHLWNRQINQTIIGQSVVRT